MGTLKMGRMKEILGALIVIGLIAVGAYLWLSPQGSRLVADKAPEVTLTKLDGGTLNLAAYRGKPILVNFWATDCPGCVEEIPDLVKLQQQFAPKGFTVIGIALSYDQPSQVRNMAAQFGMQYPLAIDTGGQAARRFGGVNLVPTSFLIDKNGRIVERKIGTIKPDVMARKIESLL